MVPGELGPTPVYSSVFYCYQHSKVNSKHECTVRKKLEKGGLDVGGGKTDGEGKEICTK